MWIITLMFQDFDVGYSNVNMLSQNDGSTCLPYSYHIPAISGNIAYNKFGKKLF